MSRKYLNDRWCARCNKQDPSPFVKKNIELFKEQGLESMIVDMGCGNGRHMRYLKKRGFSKIIGPTWLLMTLRLNIR